MCSAANLKQEAFCLTHLNFFFQQFFLKLFLQYFMMYLYTRRRYNCISMYNINKDNDKTFFPFSQRISKGSAQENSD